MKTYLLVLGLLLALVGCSDESKVKDASIEGAKERYQTQLREEIGKAVTGKANLQKIAVKTLVDKSDVEIQRQEITGEEAHVVAALKTVPTKEREALIDIMAKLDEKKEATFNVSNALNLIHQQVQAEGFELIVYKMKLQKQDGTWKVTSP
ncbi:MAG: hypothetical protein JSU04_10125 [Bdellovibrionales bacterium]|nr:hypothetical protein [Bdellovibrionales bacterium]